MGGSTSSPPYNDSIEDGILSAKMVTGRTPTPTTSYESGVERKTPKKNQSLVAHPPQVPPPDYHLSVFVNARWGGIPMFAIDPEGDFIFW